MPETLLLARLTVSSLEGNFSHETGSVPFSLFPERSTDATLLFCRGKPASRQQHALSNS